MYADGVCRESSGHYFFRAQATLPRYVDLMSAQQKSTSNSMIRRFVPVALALALLGSCASIDFHKDTTTSGTFESTGLALTIFSIDLPKGALDIARENASDARQPNTKITDAGVFPYLGPFDWILDIIGIRRATVSGTWGFPPE